MLIAFHFPPVQGSSGVQRTLRFAQHLPKFGWKPIVLTVNPFAYEATGEMRGNEIPEGLVVERAFALDTSRHLSVFGRYPLRLAMPDRWASWKFWAIRRARHILEREKVSAIWSTFPIATAHQIGLAVAQQSRLPWIAEFRDPMWQGDYPPEPSVNRCWRELEAEVFRHANRVVVTTPSAVDEYAERFPEFPSAHLVQIENGYDEDTFRRAGARTAAPRASRPFTLLHSGIVYPSERDPSHLFRAVARLKANGLLDAASFRIVLRACGNVEQYRDTVRALGVDDLILPEHGVGYLEALEEMLQADGLLLLQASNCNAQVPAKLYEYLRADRPILALTDPAGDTARTLDRAGAGLIAPLDSEPAIEQALLQFVHDVNQGGWRRPSAETVALYSRESQSRQLAELLDGVTDGAHAERRRVESPTASAHAREPT